MALFAGPRGVMTGEELTYDYNFEYVTAHEILSESLACANHVFTVHFPQRMCSNATAEHHHAAVLWAPYQEKAAIPRSRR